MTTALFLLNLFSAIATPDASIQMFTARWNGTLPPLPNVPNLSISADGKTSRTPARDELEQVVMILLREHPEEEIRRELASRVERREILLGFTNRVSGGEFLFMPGKPYLKINDIVKWPDGSIKFVISNYHDPLDAIRERGIVLRPDEYKRENYVILTFNTDFISALADTDHIVRALLLIWHEYSHFQQYQRNPNHFNGLINYCNHAPLANVIQGSCSRIWFDESNAIDTQCFLARGWGYNLNLDLCRSEVSTIEGMIERNRRVVMYLKETYNIPVCRDAWNSIMNPVILPPITKP